MFEYFPDNYSWSLTTLLSIGMGGAISEIDEVCRPLLAASTNPGPAATELWYQSWRRMGERLTRLAREDESAGHKFSASRKWLRAYNYFAVAERHLDPTDPRRLDCYRDALHAFRRGMELQNARVEFVSVPHDGSELPSLFVHADGDDDRPKPCIVHFDGLDVTKEIIYLLNGYDLAKRGVSLLICDHPGVGEALRLHGLTADYRFEAPAGSCIDYLETRDDVDPDRIGIMALSSGGIYAPRAAAFEPRLKCCVVWGAIWDQKPIWDHCTREGTQSVNFDHQLKWVFGLDDPVALEAEIRRWTLEGIMDRIECPLLVVHGENDRQAPLWTAVKTYEAAVNSPRRELKIFTLEDGAAEHCHCDNVTMGVDYMHDWIADVFESWID